MSEKEEVKQVVSNPVEASSSDEKHLATVNVDGVEKEKNDREMDEGMKYLLEHPEHEDYTEDEAKKVLRKIDWMLMPLMTVLITLAAADKIIISNAAASGGAEDLNLKGSEYSWIGSIFYFGYLVMEFPANILIQRFPVGKVLFASFVFWNAILMCMGATNNFSQMAALRFLMGMGESILFPALSVITAMFYKKKEQPFRTAIWFSGFSSVITGILSYGLLRADVSIANWRLLFLVFGAITLFFTAFMWYVIPDSPMTCKWLNERERYIAIHRTIENRTGVRNTAIKKEQLLEAATDWKTYIMALFSFANNISNSALVTFAAYIVSGLGFSILKTTLLGIPTGIFMTLSSWIIATPSYWFPKKYRTVSTAIICCVPIICCVCIMKIEGRYNLLIAYYFFYMYWGPYVSMTSISFANTSGNTKKSVTNAVNFVAYSVSNLVGPQTFLSSEAPHYTTGYNCILSFSAVSMACVITYGIGCNLENARRDRLYGPGEENVDPELDALDLTDRQKEKFFRYVW